MKHRHNCIVNGCNADCSGCIRSLEAQKENKLQDRVYIIKAKLLDTNEFIFKVGKSSGKNSVDRMLQVSRSHFMTYRYIPMMTLKRDRPCDNAFEIETKLHQLFKDDKYYFDKKIDGFNEWFYIPEHKLLKVYDELLPLKKK